jgi:hypothetical protein
MVKGRRFSHAGLAARLEICPSPTNKPLLTWVSPVVLITENDGKRVFYLLLFWFCRASSRHRLNVRIRRNILVAYPNRCAMWA